MRKLLCMALLLAPLPAAAQEAPAERVRTLTVNATGTIEREPEQGLVLLAVESEAETGKAAADENAVKMDRLMRALRRAGIPERDIRTVSYQLQPQYARDDRGQQPPRIVMYRAINMVQVTVDSVPRLGGIIDAAIGNGANRVANVQFQLRDYRAAHLEALGEAMRNARREAEAIAAAAGEQLGAALEIRSGGGHPPPPSPRAEYMRADAMGGPPPPTQIEGGTLSVTAGVNVVYELGGR